MSTLDPNSSRVMPPHVGPRRIDRTVSTGSIDPIVLDDLPRAIS
jgi:hypothetical protein